MSMRVLTLSFLLTAICHLPSLSAQSLDRLKADALADVERRAPLIQQMVDQVFSYAELGFQETESSRYLTGILRQHGFTVDTGIAGMPTAWVASWGSGKPVISIGSDIDGIPQASQFPGVACRAPMVEGAPGHGEGHNSGIPLNIAAALAVKAIMERERLPGTLRLWPGVAEELVGAKAYYVREGMFRDVDVAVFTHVDSRFVTAWGDEDATGLVSALFTFTGRSAHSAGAPWRGRSALDAVELMNVGWNYRREHLRLAHRSHYVIPRGGDQPNVVPPTASVWYYFRELDYPHITELFALGDTIARAAALMSGTELSSVRILGTAWPRHYNRPLAEAVQANIRRVGMPRWSAADQALARAVQTELGVPDSGLLTVVDSLRPPPRPQDRRGGGSDDIGDVSWTVPTVVLRYPANIPNLPGHNLANAIAMATPIAHQGTTAGAKALALSLLDILLTPRLVTDAWAYFRDVQTKTARYQPLLRPGDRPATDLNVDVMARHRDAMRPFYYDASRPGTYLDQLGITYPTVRAADGSCTVRTRSP
jgi:aminobenzoyl-glutamate utilization protein B